MAEVQFLLGVYSFCIIIEENLQENSIVSCAVNEPSKGPLHPGHPSSSSSSVITLTAAG